MKASSVMNVLPQPFGPHTPSITGTRTPPSESARKFFTMCICGTARGSRSRAEPRLGSDTCQYVTLGLQFLRLLSSKSVGALMITTLRTFHIQGAQMQEANLQLPSGRLVRLLPYGQPLTVTASKNWGEM